MSSAWWTFCSTSRIVRPCRFSSAIVSKIRSTMSGASPSDGSSSSRRRGRLISARPIASICCSPPDSVPPAWPDAAPSAAERARRPSPRPRRSRRGRSATPPPGRRFSRTVRPPKIRRPSGQCEMPSATIRSVDAWSMSAPSNVIVPGDGRSSPEIVRSVVVLPAPFEPISATSSPSPTLQRHALQRADVAVLDVDVVELKHGGPCRGRPR